MKSRVGSLYYEILLDPAGFARGASKIKREQAALMQVMKSMRANMDPMAYQQMMHQQQLAAIANARRAGKLQRDQARAMWNQSVMDHKLAMQRIQRDARMTADRVIAEKRRAQSAGGFIGRMYGEMGKLGQGILMATSRLYAMSIAVSFVARGLNSFAKATSNAYMQTQTLSNLLAGSIGKAKEMRGALVDYAQATAFSVKQTMAIAIQLKALGYQTDEIIPKIKMIGKLSFGDPARMKLIAKAMSDVRAMGRLMSREVMQFANQGIPILTELANHYKVTTAQLKNMIEAGQVSAKDTEEALKRISDRYGDTDTMGLETSQGQLERLKEEWVAFQEQFPAFEDFVFLLVKSFADIIEFMTELKKDWNESNSLVVKFIGYLFNVAGAIRDIQDTSSDLWAIWARIYGAMTGDWSWEQSIENQRRLNEANEAATEAARKKQEAEEERAKKELKAHEAAMKNKKQQLDMDLQLAKAAGDDAEIKKLEAKKRIYDAYMRGTKLAKRDGEGELLPGQDPEALGMQYAEAEKQIILNEMKDKGGNNKKKAEKMFDLPKEIFKQNSIAEFRYMQEMRKNARREAEAERRHQESMANNTANSQATIDAIDGINVQDHVDDMNVVAGI